jgi:uncharacterized Zn finger protein
MDQDRRNKIIAALESRNANMPCSRCGHKQFEIVGETILPLQNDPNVISIGGPSIPSVIVGCSQCGHIWQHALGYLKLIEGKA